MKLIVAFCKNRGIGFNNTMPWHIKNDFKNFKKLTIGNGNNAVIMGRQTWLSLPVKNRPLPKRENIVLSRNVGVYLNWLPHCIKLTQSFELAIDYCKQKKIDDIWLIGGESIYKESLNRDLVDEIYVTKIENDYECDRFFPVITDNFFLKEQSEMYTDNNVHYNFEIYKRRSTEKNNISLLHECKSQNEDNQKNVDESLQYYEESTV